LDSEEKTVLKFEDMAKNASVTQDDYNKAQLSISALDQQIMQMEVGNASEKQVQRASEQINRLEAAANEILKKISK
jgi:hypothetical protein